ncbi:MAG: hypothetical protein IJV04_03830 [Lachnospiraceae bacterium]|nr:hypothetical protein [Lachnospiraceae bacterium]
MFEMMDWYIKNLAWIRARDEYLYQELMEMVEPRPDVDWYAIDTMMRPKEWLFGLGSFSSAATVVLYGFGDGEHAMHVLDKLGEGGHLIIVVCDVPEFLEMLHIADMERMLGDPRVSIVVYGINNDILLRYLAGSLSPETISRAKVFSLPEYDEWYPEGRKFIDQALRIISQWMRG